MTDEEKRNYKKTGKAAASRVLSRRVWIPAVKTAVGAVLSIVVAELLLLQSPMTAGIITVLSIRNTKRETSRMALERMLGFICAVCVAWCAFQMAGYTLSGFAVYLLGYAVICIIASWEHALTPVSVLVTHFVLAGGMPLSLIWNELLLLAIGSGMGVLINLTLQPDAVRMDHLTEVVDQRMIRALHSLADDPFQDEPFALLDQALDAAAHQAEDNVANRLLGHEVKTSAYIRIRRDQYDVLMKMRENMREVRSHPVQFNQVCDLLHEVAEKYHRNNDVQELLDRRTALLNSMRRQQLPQNREEFESRAILFTVLLLLEHFLQIKKTYYDRYLRK